jgi:hypothetical protein
LYRALPTIRGADQARRNRPQRRSLAGRAGITLEAGATWGELMESWGPGPADYGHMRAGNADRERAIDVLKAGFAEGRLSCEELDDREARALKAVSYDELAAVCADLPAGPLGGLMPTAAQFPVAAVPGPLAPSPYAGRINRLAIASLITAFLPGYGTVASLITGHIARKQIRERGEGGAALAMAGLVISYLTTAVFVVAVVAHLINS